MALVGVGVASRRRRRTVGRAAILAYHNVVPSGPYRPGGDTSLHLPLDSFRRQMDRLMETHRIVSLAELVVWSDSVGDRPLAAITFDDAYLGAIRHAIPVLSARGLPATIFVCPGLVGGEGFWWDLAAEHGRGLAPEARQLALTEARGYLAEVTARLAMHSAPSTDHRPATLDDLQALSSHPKVSLASHTWNHPNLTRLSLAELEGELSNSRAWIQEQFPAQALADHLTFPYGLWNEPVVAAASAAGYRFLYRVDGGLADLDGSGDGPSVIPRINIPAGVSVRGFELRAAGVVG